jgi:predicted PurR-regulated permease PerM
LIGADTRRYIGVKTLIGLFTALVSYALMKFTGLNYAEFWALVIFILNFIPSLGPYFGAAIPALFALLQFSHWFPIVQVAAGIFIIQSVIANFVEPRLMGSSLNLSPLIILASLVFWGALWGIPGMFLAVPIMSIAMIFFSYFTQTRFLAIFLSAKGQIKEIHEPLSQP